MKEIKIYECYVRNWFWDEKYIIRLSKRTTIKRVILLSDFLKYKKRNDKLIEKLETTQEVEK